VPFEADAAQIEGNRTLASTSITIGHQLGKAEAARRINAEVDRIAVMLKAFVEIARAQWHDDAVSVSTKALGFTVASMITVSDKTVTIDGDLPFVLLPLKSAILKFVVERGERLLAGEDAASEQMIRLKAYEIWESEGRPAGKDESHWLEAVERMSKHQGDPKTPPEIK
jgi:Protein of unknown function (DUF2934)/Putative polyhydroxyalkanoic acid system protein (PHA_gran_rgn)